MRVAILPSSVIAHFEVDPRPAGAEQFEVRRVEPPRLGLAQPDVNLEAGVAENLSPPPATFGNGSAIAATTRRTPDRSTASVQGGVFPQWQHGSSVTTSVPPRAAHRPAQRVHLGVRPAEPLVPALADELPCGSRTTAPTIGFGSTNRGRGRRAQGRAASSVRDRSRTPLGFRAKKSDSVRTTVHLVRLCSVHAGNNDPRRRTRDTVNYKLTMTLWHASYELHLTAAGRRSRGDDAREWKPAGG